MQLTINIEKRHVFIIFASILLLAIVLGVSAYTKSLGNKPNPGHSLSEIQGYFEGDANLEASLGKFCQSDKTNCQYPVSSCSLACKETGKYTYYNPPQIGASCMDTNFGGVIIDYKKGALGSEKYYERCCKVVCT